MLRIWQQRTIALQGRWNPEWGKRLRQRGRLVQPEPVALSRPRVTGHDRRAPGALVDHEHEPRGHAEVAAGLAHFAPNSFEMHHRWSPGWVGAMAVLFGLGLFMLYGSRPAPYLYFQF